MDLGLRRQKAPLWPPSRQGAYQNLSSTEDLHLQDTPSISTPGTAALRSLLTPNIAPSPYTPGLDSTGNTPYTGGSPEELKYESEKPKRNWFGHGWRGGARIAFSGTVFTLLVNTTLIIYMTTAFEKMDGFPVVYRGTCEDVEKLNTGWHLAINVLSTGLLSASNYCMQLLSAPTRANIDKAHSRGHWLDIGVLSMRNLRFLSWKRQILWLALSISSIPLHLVYNSTFYAAIATNDYNILYATEDFVKGSGYDKTQFPNSPAQNVSAFQQNASSWQKLNNHDCIQQYAHDFITKYRNVIAVVTNVTNEPDNTLLQIMLNELPTNGIRDHTFDAFAWICNDTLTTNKTGVTHTNSAGFVPCGSQATALENMANSWWRSGGYDISYCLAEEIKPDCHLHFSPHLMAPVIVMNIIKCLVAFYVAFRMLDVPLVTLGDAIESFIKHPDSMTAGQCLLTARESERSFHKNVGNYGPQPENFQSVRERWHKVVTKGQKLLLVSLVLIMVTGLLVGMILGTKNLAPSTFSNAFSIGLGTVQTQNLVLGANLPQLGAKAVLVTALVANAPQAVLSFLYMVYNTIFTLMSIGEDWDRFGAYTSTTRHRLQIVSKKQTHRYLRCSNSKGNQKSTHILNLPYRHAIPLILASGGLHWIMSQTLYLANISVIPRDGTLPRQDEITTVAFAPLGMLLLVVLGLIMFATALVTGMRRFGGQMQIVASNSAAISAACHIEHMPERRRREMVLRKIAWGEIPSSDDDSRLPDFQAGGQQKRHLTSSSEHEMNLGLGIDSDVTKMNMLDTVYSVNDFNDAKDRDRDLEQDGYQASGERVRMVDSHGVGRSSAVAHCSFSDGFVFKPETGKLYA